jgi:hypothetical protein
MASDDGSARPPQEPSVPVQPETGLDLEPIKARVKEATPAPWRLHEVARDNGDEDVWVVFNDADDSSMMQRQDADFIAHARTDIPALIAEVEALRSASLRETAPAPAPKDKK